MVRNGVFEGVDCYSNFWNEVKKKLKFEIQMKKLVDLELRRLVEGNSTELDGKFVWGVENCESIFCKFA